MALVQLNFLAIHRSGVKVSAEKKLRVYLINIRANPCGENRAMALLFRG
jgi:hypothetical protein